MSSHHASSCSCGRQSSRSHGSVGSHSRSQSQGWASTCGCGDRAVVRTATTIINYRRRFLGCRNFRPNDPGCNYFDWYYEGVTNEREQTIMRQRSKIEELNNNANELRNTVTELKNSVNELTQKIDEATSSMNAQNHIMEAQNRKIASLEMSLTKSKKWTKIWEFSFTILLMAWFCALGDKGNVVPSARLQLN